MGPSALKKHLFSDVTETNCCSTILSKKLAFSVDFPRKRKKPIINTNLIIIVNISYIFSVLNYQTFCNLSFSEAKFTNCLAKCFWCRILFYGLHNAHWGKTKQSIYFWIFLILKPTFLREQRVRFLHLGFNRSFSFVADYFIWRNSELVPVAGILIVRKWKFLSIDVSQSSSSLFSILMGFMSFIKAYPRVISLSDIVGYSFVPIDIPMMPETGIIVT